MPDFQKAPDLATLYDFETQLEAAFAYVFKQAGINSETAKSADTVATPYVSIQCTVGKELERYVDSSGATRNQAWGFTARLEVNTCRTVDQAKDMPDHGQFRGKIRSILSRFFDPGIIDEYSMPFLNLARLVDVGSSLQTHDENDIDTTTLTCEGVFYIRDTAWQVA